MCALAKKTGVRHYVDLIAKALEENSSGESKDPNFNCFADATNE